MPKNPCVGLSSHVLDIISTDWWGFFYMGVRAMPSSLGAVVWVHLIENRHTCYLLPILQALQKYTLWWRTYNINHFPWMFSRAARDVTEAPILESDAYSMTLDCDLYTYILPGILSLLLTFLWVPSFCPTFYADMFAYPVEACCQT